MTQPITGYRELSTEELALINEGKDLGAAIEKYVLKVAQHISVYEIESLHPTNAINPRRWLMMGQSDLQTGLMALTRAIAQPENF